MRKRSRSPEGTDEPRTGPDKGPDPAKAETRPGGQPGKPQEGGRPGEGRRRNRHRKGHRDDKATGQGSLFDEEPARTPGSGSPDGDRSPTAGDRSAAEKAQAREPGAESSSAEGKKSRSKRRRERRKAKTAVEGKPGQAAPERAPEAREPREARPKGERQGQQGQRRPKDEQGRQGNRQGQGQGQDRRRGRDGRPQRPEPGARRFPASAEGLSPLSPESLAAGIIPDFGEDEGIPRYVSNLQPSARSSLRKQAPSARPLESLAPSGESLAAMEKLQVAIEETFPLHGKHRDALKGDVRRLWEELTSDRESRSVDYLGTPPALSAYLRYFLPWNVFRLSSILSNADFCLPDNAVIVDIGSGPLTFPIALWASRPELRDLPLTIYCMDRVERALEAGKAIFETFCLRAEGRLPPWRLELRKDSFGASLPERAHLLVAANVFNEFFWKDKRPLGERAIEVARSLVSYLRIDGSLFVMEPGDPRSGAFIAALRAALLAEGASPLGPCPHSLSCPMPGIFRHLLPPEETRVAKGDPNAAPSRYVLPPVAMPKKRDKFPWCHFGVDTERAPAWLQAVSAEAGLPKEKAVLSYLWAARGAAARPFGGVPELARPSEKERRAKAAKGTLVRVVSEPFGLPDGSAGQYACSSLGYTLVKRRRGDAPFEPGALLEVSASPLPRNDEKSGAIVLPS